MYNTESIESWILVWGFALLVLELVILRIYNKRSTITPKKIYNATIVIILGLVTQFTVISQIGSFLLQSKKDNCFAYEVSQIPINGTRVSECATHWNSQEFQLITIGVIMTVITLSIQLRELVKNRDR